MREKLATRPQGLTLPADMLESVLRGAQRLADEAQALLAPVAEQRERLRAVLWEDKQILTVPQPPSGISLGAVDGGYVIDQMYAADRLVVAGLVAEGMRTVRTGELHHATWSYTLAHQLDLDRLASAVMTCLELGLLRAIGYDLRVFDGSHQTPVIALNSALSSENPRVRALTADIVKETDAVEALRTMCDDAVGAMILGLPKADSSTEFCQKYRRKYEFPLPPITDRFLAAQVLDRGEMLKPRKPENWDHLHINFRRRPRRDEEVETNQRVQAHVEATARALDKAIEPLRHCGEQGRGIGITYLKPHQSDACVKVEFKASKKIDHGRWLASILSAEVIGPHMQEPYAQFVADLWAKNVSMAADALDAAARYKMPSDARWVQYLTIGYRTQAAGGHR